MLTECRCSRFSVSQSVSVFEGCREAMVYITTKGNKSNNTSENIKQKNRGVIVSLEFFFFKRKSDVEKHKDSLTSDLGKVALRRIPFCSVKNSSIINYQELYKFLVITSKQSLLAPKYRKSSLELTADRDCLFLKKLSSPLDFCFFFYSRSCLNFVFHWMWTFFMNS